MRRQSDGEVIRLSGRTRLILRILFLGGLGWAWYWLLVEVPRRELWYLIGFSIVLGVVFEWLERNYPRCQSVERRERSQPPAHGPG